MSMEEQRWKELRNFTPPCDVGWGNHRHRRRSHGFSDHMSGQRWKLDSDCVLVGSPEFGPSAAIEIGDEDQNGIEAMRMKVIHDLQIAAEKMRDAIWKEGLNPTFLPPSRNLRKRRAASVVAGRLVGGKGFMINSSVPPSGIPRMQSSSKPALGTIQKSPPHPNNCIGTAEDTKRVRFSIPLSKREIEDDFLHILGRRPPRRPKKRPQIVQRHLNELFPGLWLKEITADMYKVLGTAATPRSNRRNAKTKRK